MLTPAIFYPLCAAVPIYLSIYCVGRPRHGNPKTSVVRYLLIYGNPSLRAFLLTPAEEVADRLLAQRPASGLGDARHLEELLSELVVGQHIHLDGKAVPRHHARLPLPRRHRRLAAAPSLPFARLVVAHRRRVRCRQPTRSCSRAWCTRPPCARCRSRRVPYLPALPIPCRPQLGPPRHEALSVHLPRPHTMQARCWQSTRSHAISGRDFSPPRPRPILVVLLTRLRAGSCSAEAAGLSSRPIPNP